MPAFSQGFPLQTRKFSGIRRRSRAESHIPVTWSVCGIDEVEGESLESIVENFDEIQEDIPLPSGASYVDGSFALSMDDVDTIREIYNQDKSQLSSGDKARIATNMPAEREH